MPKRPKPKVKSNAGDKRYDGQATSQARFTAQLEREKVNRWAFPELTPWQEAKAKRLAERIAKGKTRENWERTHVVKPNSSNTITSTTGPKHRKNVQPKSRDPYDARESYGIQ